MVHWSMMLAHMIPTNTPSHAQKGKKAGHQTKIFVQEKTKSVLLTTST
jgi:hypothetical protein